LRLIIGDPIREMAAYKNANENGFERRDKAESGLPELETIR
jgi:hypothetical protein